MTTAVPPVGYRTIYVMSLNSLPDVAAPTIAWTEDLDEAIAQVRDTLAGFAGGATTLAWSVPAHLNAEQTTAEVAKLFSPPSPASPPTTT